MNEEIKEQLRNLIGHIEWVAIHFNIHYAHIDEAKELLKKLEQKKD